MTDRKLRWVEPPAFLLAIAALVGVLGIGMSFVGSQKGGIFTDDPGHALRLTHYLKDGLYIRNFEIRRTAEGETPDGAYVYGPATLLLAHQINRLITDQDPYEAGMWPRDYEIRHAVVAALALAGLLATVGLAWAVSGSWRWGVVAGGVLAALPLWTGHAMFNPKDVPVAAGHTMFTLGLVLLAMARPTTRFRWLLASGAVLAAGAYFALGTRPGTWAPMLVVFGVFVLAVLRSHPVQTPRNLLRVWTVTLASLAAAYAGLIILYPKVFLNPLTMARISAASSAEYESFGNQPRSDRSYIFTHLATDIPTGLLALMLVGTVVVVWMLVIQRRRESEVDGMALVGAQAYAILTAAVLLDTVLYNGLRQVLFAFPALSVLAAIGLATLMTALAGKPPVQAALTVAATLALVLPTAVQLSMFPYQYAYINVAAEQSGVKAEEDYFGTSFKEFRDREPQTIKITCPFLRFGGAVRRFDSDCRTREQGTFSTYWRGRIALDDPERGEFYALLRGDRATPPNCTVVSDVRRWRNLESTVMSRMYKCHRPTPSESLRSLKHKNALRIKAGYPPKKKPHGLGEPIVHDVPRPEVLTPVTSYVTRRGTALVGGNAPGAIRMHFPKDVEQLKGAPADLKAYLSKDIARRTKTVKKDLGGMGVTAEQNGCGYLLDLAVSGFTPDIAVGRVWGCDQGASKKVIWAKKDGKWQVASATNSGWDCSELQYYRVPAAIADGDCWTADGWLDKYNGPKRN